MEDVAQIKSRLPIEQLVAGYCQLQKKGRNFVCLCPFHNDKKPSLLVSPDKGIAYCFACSSGGDIFSFYQKIEGVDFATAIRDLAERAGVTLSSKPTTGPKKDEKDRARECLVASQKFFAEQLLKSAPTLEYLTKRGVTKEQIQQFGIGLAPDSFTATYDHLLKAGFSRTEIVLAGMGVQRDLKEERIYDRFRNRLMFPIYDARGLIVGFGGRTLGNDDAKYVNTSDGALYHKSEVLYAFHNAKEAIRETKKVVIVEGYFDVLACHRIGIKNAVAACGTALTEQHGKILRRIAETAVLCLDSDRAGQEAMERAFPLLAGEGMHVEAVQLSEKDPADLAVADPIALKTSFDAPSSYLDLLLQQMLRLDLHDPLVKRQALTKILRLLSALPSAVERNDYLQKTATIFQTTESALQQDLLSGVSSVPAARPKPVAEVRAVELFSSEEVALGLLLLYPRLHALVSELIRPTAQFAASLYTAIEALPQGTERLEVNELPLEAEHKERASLLILYCEHHGLAEWSDSMATREIRKNCIRANREVLKIKLQEITRRLLDARLTGQKAAELDLQNQYQQVLKLLQKAA